MRALALSFEIRALFAEKPVAEIACGIEKIPEAPIGNAVAHEEPLAAGYNEPFPTKRRQVLRDRRLAEFERLLQLGDSLFALTKGVEKADPRGMRERLKEVRLKVSQHIWILAYSDFLMQAYAVSDFSVPARWASTSPASAVSSRFPVTPNIAPASIALT